MKKDNKIALILIGFIIIFILTFVFLGGIDAIIELLILLVEKSEEATGNLIDLFKWFIDIFK